MAGHVWAPGWQCFRRLAPTAAAWVSWGSQTEASLSPRGQAPLDKVPLCMHTEHVLGGPSLSSDLGTELPFSAGGHSPLVF